MSYTLTYGNGQRAITFKAETTTEVVRKARALEAIGHIAIIRDAAGNVMELGALNSLSGGREAGTG